MMNLEELTRRQIRYLLFKIKGAETEEVITYRTRGRPPLRRVMDREEAGLPFEKGEAKAILAGWGFDMTASASDKFIESLRAHYEAQEWFSGWKFFAEPNGVFAGWDVGIEGDDTATQTLRPEKAWLFGKSRFDVCLRGANKDGDSAIEQETGEKAAKFETEVL